MYMVKRLILQLQGIFADIVLILFTIHEGKFSFTLMYSKWGVSWSWMELEFPPHDNWNGKIFFQNNSFRTIVLPSCFVIGDLFISQKMRSLSSKNEILGRFLSLHRRSVPPVEGNISLRIIAKLSSIQLFLQELSCLCSSFQGHNRKFNLNESQTIFFHSIFSDF